MKTILYATDYSDNSIAALKYAHDMCVRMDAKLLVTHVGDYPTVINSKPGKSIKDLKNSRIEENNEKLEQFCKANLGEDWSKLNIKTEAIVDKSIVNGIVSKAKEVQSCLIITGMKGTSRLRKLIMGSTARNLIKEAPYPVLTIPEGTSFNEIKTIVYATDFQDQDLGAIKNLVEIAEPLHAKIKVVHVAPLKEVIDEGERKVLDEKLNKYVKYKNMELHIIYSNHIFNELKTYYGEKNADIIAMLERENNGIGKKLFYQNLLEKMKSYGKVPLMSFNAKNYGMFHL
ncbi:MAG TPA: universal stress protein [Flavobacteriaceae bacterium]|nr:universal stress protein [Flavobacteriaceae bacterium]